MSIISAIMGLTTLIGVGLMLWMYTKYHKSVMKRFNNHFDMILDTQKTAVEASMEITKLRAELGVGINASKTDNTQRYN